MRSFAGAAKGREREKEERVWLALLLMSGKNRERENDVCVLEEIARDGGGEEEIVGF